MWWAKESGPDQPQSGPDLGKTYTYRLPLAGFLQVTMAVARRPTTWMTRRLFLHGALHLIRFDQFTAALKVLNVFRCLPGQLIAIYHLLGCYNAT